MRKEMLWCIFNDLCFD